MSTPLSAHSDTVPSSAPRRLLTEKAMFGLLRLIAALNVLVLVGICVFLLVQGLPALSWEFLSEPPRKMMTEGGILPCIIGTAILSLGALLLAFPLGVLSAVYLHEYAGRSRLAGYVRLGVNNLAGVPSVVFGLFGLSFFVTFCGFGVCILSGVLTLAVLTLPVIINTAEEALRALENKNAAAAKVSRTPRKGRRHTGQQPAADQRLLKVRGKTGLRVNGVAYGF